MANIIKQLKDANGNNIYPIAYAQGGVKMDLLWTNPSPTSNFSAQNISLDLTNYPLFLIEFCRHTSDTSHRPTIVDTINSEGQAVGFIGGGGCFRTFTSSSSGINFDGGTSGASGNNAYMIPYKIYGIKMSYIVPTVVNGLQYVEV